MKDEPLRWLSAWLDTESRSDGPPAPLPTLAELEIKERQLWANQAALAYLRTERCLTDKTIEDYRIGWEPGAFVFPIINNEGMLVNLVRRPLPHVSGPRYIALRGHNKDNGGVQLYPDVPKRPTWLLVEGLFDALLGRQGDLPTVTSTHGVSTFLPEWLPLVKGRRVAVMYDVGAEQVTRHRVEELTAAGADAWAVDLSPLLDGGKDLTDYVAQGGTRDVLVAHITDERLRAG